MRFGARVFECPIPTPALRVLLMRRLTIHILSIPLSLLVVVVLCCVVVVVFLSEVCVLH
jgi:hypothetical protein